MPRECPELVGENLGWDMFLIAQADGSPTVIERAVSITDLCTRVKEVPGGSQQVVLCFCTSQGHGACVWCLTFLDLEEYLLSEQVGIFGTTIQSVREMSELGEQFIAQVEQIFGVSREQLLKVIVG